jgi:hypothetical protein
VSIGLQDLLLEVLEIAVLVARVELVQSLGGPPSHAWGYSEYSIFQWEAGPHAPAQEQHQYETQL